MKKGAFLFYRVMKQGKNELTKSIKNAKLFLLKDIFVYLSLFLFIIVLFLIFIIPSTCNKQKNSGFIVTVKNQTVLTFNAKNSSPISITEEYLELVEVTKEQSIYTVKIYLSLDKKSFNTLSFNKDEISAKVIESTCSQSKDCVYTPKITDNGSIYCAPHGLKIVPLTTDGFIPPTTG